MTPKQKAYHANLIKQVHLSLRYKNYYRENRDEYVELLKESFNKSSSKDLTVSELVGLVDYLNMKGTCPSLCHQTGLISKKQLEYIKGLWAEIARVKTDETLLSFVIRQTGVHYTQLKNIKMREAQKLIPVLIKMRGEHGTD